MVVERGDKTIVLVFHTGAAGGRCDGKLKIKKNYNGIKKIMASHV